MTDRPKRNRKKSQKQNDADASDQHLQDDDDELLFITIGNYEYDISEVQEWPIENMTKHHAPNSGLFMCWPRARTMYIGYLLN